MCASVARPATVAVDVAQRYGGVSLNAIDRAVADARRHFLATPDDTLVLRLPAGVFPLSPDADGAESIDVSDVSPGSAGRLVVQGAGSDKTTLVFDTHRDEIFGRNTHHVTFAGLHFTIGHMTVSQGRVEAVSPRSVVLRIDDGFPTPADLFNAALNRGRYLRRCTGTEADPHIDEDPAEVQVPWLRAEALPGNLWRLDIRPRAGSAFRDGDRLAIKSKNDNGNAYRFIGGDDVTFDDVTWTRVTRGVFRGGMGHVRILNSAILRDPPVHGRVPCLASAAGGPQIGQPRDAPTTGNVVRHFTASGTGDDALAFFNASGTVTDVTISNSFARGILLFRSPGVLLSGIHVLRAPVLRAP